MQFISLFNCQEINFDWHLCVNKYLTSFAFQVFGFLAFCSFDDYARAYHKLFKSLKNLEPGMMGQHYPRAQQPVPQQNLGLQNLAMQQDPGSQRPFMQQHPGVQQPVMQQHAGAQQNDPGV